MKQQTAKGKLKWWQLSLIGVGCTIGTGFFLGSSIAIRKSGFSVLAAFLLAALGTFLVFQQLAKLTADHPVEGSFCSYAREAFGDWAGFSNGWVYWSSEMLIIGSQLTAISLFTRHWFQQIPLWVFASIYAILGLIIIFTGRGSFEKTENMLAVLKTAAILMFVIIAILALCGVLPGETPDAQVPDRLHELFPFGFMGLWTGLIYTFYAYGGIEVLGLMAVDLKDPKEAGKSGSLMLITLASVYVISIGLALLLIPVGAFTEQDSPFITSLKPFKLDLIMHIFNGIFIIAGFSTLTASLFAVTTLMGTMAKNGDAPACFSKKENAKVSWPALGLTVLVLAASIILSLLLPKQLYEHMTTAASLMLLYNWMFILFSSKKLTKPKLKGNVQIAAALILIVFAVSGTLFEKNSRPGFFVSLLFLAIIAAVTLLMKKKWTSSRS
ncbi:amino acid permease [Bacillus sonorensis]|uniref:Amino acid transporter YcgH n=2 Tax=Bacillus sonorensis TaxID=119858 RepID=M5P006_9BACI|nr:MULTISPECIES: amino acid permease [Bacillus]TWK73851.1 Aromatic amino acid transport protein AroP [Bacillus paralicheniformis]ASB91157.1 putative transporter YcgH [Bacillus sonorensis]EME72799.1 amino acid transporter YcgH [Bacillus sonorensis L12]MCF7619945.1 amino acid permease [Bacillus sonorensis]MCY7857058.1 amino acid permease [Bacillus sonorensis]